MLRASALYMVIIVTLVISVICSALIVAAYLYKSEYQARFRMGQLRNNVSSGMTILLHTQDSVYKAGRSFSLFNGDADSVSLRKTTWGVFDVCSSVAFINRDTLYKVFSLAKSIDSAKWAVLYLIDEDRPVSVSGNTRITGDAYLPKAGIRPAYVENHGYTGDKKIINGDIRSSERKLPELSTARLAYLKEQLILLPPEKDLPNNTDSIENSFLKPPVLFSFGKQVKTISGISLKGNIIIHSDTTLVIDSTAKLENVLVFAKGILVKSGFRGNCQLFATDSVGIESHCRFGYPSVIGVLRFNTGNTTGLAAKLNIGPETQVDGLIFSYQKDEKQLQPLITLGKKTKVDGQVYSSGLLSLKAGTRVNGSVFSSRFLYQSEFTMYENYLIDVTINSRTLSPYYLGSELLPVAGKQNKILQWLENN